MITQHPGDSSVDAESDSSSDEPSYPCVLLARYGTVPQVARFGVTADMLQTLGISDGHSLSHGTDIVTQTDRGVEVASVLEVIHAGIISEEKGVTGAVLRIAAAEDLEAHRKNRREADPEFLRWQDRLDEWQLQLQIVDMEWTLDREQLILYVLNSQDAETTRLALLAAAAGLGIVHVQPVAAQGIVEATGGGGCGSGGCGSGGCH